MRTTSVRRGWKPGLAALAVGAVSLGGVVAAPLAANAAEVEVTGVTFDWGINNESNGGAYFGGCNFLSAGVAGDTGSSRLWSQADGFYSAQEGNTTIVKPTADATGLQQPTWSTKCQTPSGATVNGKTTNADTSYTQSRVQIANGSGTVDVAAGTADIEWDGSFSVVYYGGMTYWSATDPHLVVDSDGTGTVTASLSGYAADMDFPDVWKRLEPREITIATLTDVEVTASGIIVTPDYLGVTVPEDVEGRNPQETSQTWSGAFPGDFVSFQQETGQSSYWYSTSGDANSIQPRKVTLPLTVSYTTPEAVAITTQPTAQSVSLGESATFSVAASGATGYQWQSAATGSDTWTDVANATSAEYTVVGTTASAKQYRVVVSGSGGPVTSDAAALTVSVPTPTVTVSKTSDLDPDGEFVTVTGSGFLPNPPATSGTRPPLSGKFTGAYIALAQSVGGTLTNHTNSLSDYTTWGVHAEDIAAIGGSGAVINADGTFSVQIKAEKFATSEGGVWGIRTYAAGGASYAAFSTFTPVTFAVLAPDAPAAPTATLGTDGTSVDVAWTAPDDNGEPISGYDVTLTPSTGAASTVSVPSSALSTSFSGLTRGVSYTATVVAKNAGGSSAASEASAAVSVPAVAPEAPAAPTASAAGTTSVNVSWTAPADGGSPITGYTVTVSKGGSLFSTTPATGLTATIEGLTAATDYTVTVSATNAVGTSDESPAASVTTLAEAPGSLAAPTVVAASGTSLNVSWVAPSDDGGSAVTGYVVTVLNGTDVAATKDVDVVTTTTVDGLQPGTSYTVTVAAKNAQGTGSASPASAVVRTWSVPEAPAVTAALEGATGVSASWTAPADGGSAITGYTAELRKDGAVVQAKTAAGTSVAFDGLVPGGVYTVSVTATNAVGVSSAGVSGAVTVPAVAPAAPGTPVLTAGADGASVSAAWTAPASDGGSAITGYTVSLSDAGGVVAEKDVAADARSVVFTGLAKGDYRVTVTAVTAVGATDSAASAAVSLAGPAPTEAPAEVAESELTGESGGDAEITITGSTVTIDLGAEHANTWVGVTVHSDPVFLGWFLTDASGVVTTTLPADLPAGAHYVVVQAADGTVLGYQAFTVAASGGATTPGTGTTGSALATTGADVPLGWAALAVLLLVVGGTVVLIARRKAIPAAE